MKCLLSLLNQDLKRDEFEIIVVNDGSTDNSAQVVSDLQERHPNIILVNQKNSGTGATRNNALKYARGKYINFIDADDFVIENSYKTLLEMAEKKDLDLLMLNQAIHVNEAGDFIKDDSHSILSKSILRSSHKIYKGIEFLNQSTHNDGVVSTIFKKSFLNDNNISFSERTFLEDVEFMYKAVFHSKRMMSIEERVYRVVLSNDSSTRHNDHEKHAKSIIDIKNVLREMILFSENNLTEYPKARRIFNQKINIYAISLLGIFSKTTSNKKEAKQFLKELKNLALFPITFNFYKAMPFKSQVAYFINYHRINYLRNFKSKS